jgi:phosphoribosylaminoimidazolecarboxamide formyltransferase/IMP cyclohydrolase
VTDPADYARLLAEMDANPAARPRYAFRRLCAAKAYAATAAYDGMRSNWFAADQARQKFPHRAATAQQARQAALWREPASGGGALLPTGPHGAPGIARREQVQGKELSYNNINDADAALELVAEFRDGAPTVVIVKHANPCGVAGATLLEAYQLNALACDSRLGLRRHRRGQPPLDGPTARSDQRHLHRGGHRPRTPTSGQGRLREEEEPAPAADRRPARSARARPDRENDRGRLLVQDRDNGRDVATC